MPDNYLMKFQINTPQKKSHNSGLPPGKRMHDIITDIEKQAIPKNC
jgi:hypothetical protein